MKLSEKLAKLRKNSKMNQKEVSEKIGVARQTISNWETGVSVPDAYQLAKLAKAFNITVEDLIKDVKEMQ